MCGSEHKSYFVYAHTLNPHVQCIKKLYRCDYVFTPSLPARWIGNSILFYFTVDKIIYRLGVSIK